MATNKLNQERWMHLRTVAVCFLSDSLWWR